MVQDNISISHLKKLKLSKIKTKNSQIGIILFVLQQWTSSKSISSKYFNN